MRDERTESTGGGSPPDLPLFRDFPVLEEQLPHIPLGLLPTPVEELTQIGNGIGVKGLYIKRDDVSGAVYGGNKVRKLEFLLAEAREGNARGVMTFGFAGSNHALATAIYARQVGLTCTSLLMHQVNAHYVRRNLLAGFHYGARLCHYRNLPLLSLGSVTQLLRSRSACGAFPRLIPAGGSCPLGVIGYVNAALELRDQIAAGELPEPDLLYVPLGSMGTAAGLKLGLSAVGIKTRVIPVRVIEERMARARGMMRLIRRTEALLCRLDPTFPRAGLSNADPLILNDCLGEGYARFTEKGVAAAKLMKDDAGIVLNGAYSAKAFSAVLDAAERGELRGKTVLFWNTYNSRALAEVAAGVDYRQLPKAFHRYFREQVQPLDPGEG